MAVSRDNGSWGAAFGEEAADKASGRAFTAALWLWWLSHWFRVRLQEGGLFFHPVAGGSRAGSSVVVVFP